MGPQERGQVGAKQVGGVVPVMGELGIWGYCTGGHDAHGHKGLQTQVYLELGPKRDARVMSSQASFLVIRALKPLLSVPLWTQERSSLEPHLHHWMRVQLSQALGRTLAQAGRVSAMKGRQEWCWGRRPHLTDLSPPRNSGPHSGQ